MEDIEKLLDSAILVTSITGISFGLVMLIDLLGGKKWKDKELMYYKN